MRSRQNVHDTWDALGIPLYAFATLLVALPALDFAQSVGTPQLSSVQWRFATVGLLSSVLLTPMLGLVIAIVTASVRGDLLAVRLLALLCATCAAVLLILLGGFVLDIMQLRGTIPEAGRPGFRIASIKAATKHSLAFLVLSLLAFRAWRMSAWRTPPGTRGPIPIVSR